jgi:hypothetical protein
MHIVVGMSREMHKIILGVVRSKSNPGQRTGLIDFEAATRRWFYLSPYLRAELGWLLVEQGCGLRD